jgi:hypothetical protein
MKFVSFPDGAKGALGIALICVATLIVVNRFLPAKAKAFVQGA